MNKSEGVLWSWLFVCVHVCSIHILYMNTYLCVPCLSVYLLSTRVTFITEGARVWRRKKTEKFEYLEA